MITCMTKVMEHMNFSACKIALMIDNRVLVYLRDDDPEIPYPNHWDFPGGQRKKGETPQCCVLRELQEEFGLLLTEDRLLWRRDDPGGASDGGCLIVYAGEVLPAEITSIEFGDEGQYWELMAVRSFMEMSMAVGPLQNALRIYLSEG